jgi:zinc transporter 2
LFLIQFRNNPSREVLLNNCCDAEHDDKKNNNNNSSVTITDIGNYNINNNNNIYFLKNMEYCQVISKLKNNKNNNNNNSRNSSNNNNINNNNKKEKINIENTINSKCIQLNLLKELNTNIKKSTIDDNNKTFNIIDDCENNLNSVCILENKSEKNTCNDSNNKNFMNKNLLLEIDNKSIDSNENKNAIKNSNTKNFKFLDNSMNINNHNNCCEDEQMKHIGNKNKVFENSIYQQLNQHNHQSHTHDDDVNMQAAYLHVLTDLLQSIGVAIAGFIYTIYTTYCI